MVGNGLIWLITNLQKYLDYVLIFKILAAIYYQKAKKIM